MASQTSIVSGCTSHVATQLDVRRVQGSNLLVLADTSFQDSRITVLPTLQIRLLYYNRGVRQHTLEERSAGGVVYRRVGGKVEFLIGKHSGYHKWVLPKGLVERGESAMEAAVREVAEEVGVEAKIVDLTPIKTIDYWYFADMDKSGATTRRVEKYAEEGGAKTRVHKQVTFYLMEMEKDLGSAGWEMEDRAWVSYEEGMELLAFPTEREVLGVANKAT